MAVTTMQGTGLIHRSNLGFFVLIKVTSTCGQEDQEIELTTLRSMDNWFYLLSHSLLVFRGGNQSFQTNFVHIIDVLNTWS